MYKRNFTFGLASPSDARDGAAWIPSGGPVDSWLMQDGTFPVGTDGHDVTAIGCLVNTFGQDEIFEYGNYNGLCFNARESDRGGNTTLSPLAYSLITLSGFSDAPTFKSCIVEFATTTNQHKQTVGNFNGWEIKGIYDNPILSIH
jgi:hypothetical protein